MGGLTARALTPCWPPYPAALLIGTPTHVKHQSSQKIIGDHIILVIRGGARSSRPASNLPILPCLPFSLG